MNNTGLLQSLSFVNNWVKNPISEFVNKNSWNGLEVGRGSDNFLLSILNFFRRISITKLWSLCLILLYYVVYLHNRIRQLTLELTHLKEINAELIRTLEYSEQVIKNQSVSSGWIDFVTSNTGMLVSGAALLLVGGLVCFFLFTKEASIVIDLNKGFEYRFFDSSGVEYLIRILGDSTELFLLVDDKIVSSISQFFKRLADSPGKDLYFVLKHFFKGL